MIVERQFSYVKLNSFQDKNEKTTVYCRDLVGFIVYTLHTHGVLLLVS